VLYGNNFFVVLGAGGTILTSADGMSWTKRVSGTLQTLRGVTYGNNTFVVRGEGATILQSDPLGSSAPRAPVLSVTVSGLNVNLRWAPVAGADGYTVFYSPYPDAEYVANFDVGEQTDLSVDLWPEASFSVWIQAYNGAGSSESSNTESFIVHKPTPSRRDLLELFFSTIND
jgi:hypothetical protein